MFPFFLLLVINFLKRKSSVTGRGAWVIINGHWVVQIDWLINYLFRSIRRKDADGLELAFDWPEFKQAKNGFSKNINKHASFMKQDEPIKQTDKYNYWITLRINKEYRGLLSKTRILFYLYMDKVWEFNKGIAYYKFLKI